MDLIHPEEISEIFINDEEKFDKLYSDLKGLDLVRVCQYTILYMDPPTIEELDKFYERLASIVDKYDFKFYEGEEGLALFPEVVYRATYLYHYYFDNNMIKKFILKYVDRKLVPEILSHILYYSFISSKKYTYISELLKSLSDLNMLDIEEAKVIIKLCEEYDMFNRLKNLGEIRWNSEEAKIYYETHKLANLI